MPFSHRRGRGKARKEHFLLFSMLFIFSLGAIGIGFAAWEDTLRLEGTLTTGSIEAVFTEVYLSDTGEGWGRGQGKGSGKEVESVSIIDEGKGLLVQMDNPKHGNYFLIYTIKNQGNLPVEVKTITQTCSDALDIQMLHEPEGVIAGEETASGQFKISVKKVEEDCIAKFMVQLVCKQASVL